MLTDDWFEKNCLDINVIKWLVRRVERLEESARRDINKKKVDNNTPDKATKKENSLKMSA